MAATTGISSGVRRLIVSEILIVLILIACLIGFLILKSKKPEVQQKEIVAARLNVDVFDAELATFQELLTGFGTARPDREVLVAAQVSGEIVDIHPELKVGQFVSAGQFIPPGDGPSERRDADLLLRIDPRDLQERASQATNSIGEANDEIERLKLQKDSVSLQVEQAQSILKTLQEEYDRVERAASLNAQSKSDLSRALLEVQRYQDSIIKLQNQEASIPLQIASARKRLLSSEADKAQAENDLARTEIVPPFDGLISEVFVEKGRYVRTGDQIIRLTDPSIVEIPVSLGFDDFVKLQEVMATGLNPSVSLAENESSKAHWTGILRRVSPKADSRSRTVEVFVEVTNDKGRIPLLPGAFVFATIDGAVYEDTLLVPREAVVDGAVYVVDEENKARVRPVRLGARFQSLVIVEGGIGPEDRVIITNLDLVEEGKEVAIQSATNALREMQLVRSPLIRFTGAASE